MTRARENEAERRRHSSSESATCDENVLYMRTQQQQQQSVNEKMVTVSVMTRQRKRRFVAEKNDDEHHDQVAEAVSQTPIVKDTKRSDTSHASYSISSASRITSESAGLVKEQPAETKAETRRSQKQTRTAVHDTGVSRRPTFEEKCEPEVLVWSETNTGTANTEESSKHNGSQTKINASKASQDKRGGEDTKLSTVAKNRRKKRKEERQNSSLNEGSSEVPTMTSLSAEESEEKLTAKRKKCQKTTLQRKSSSQTEIASHIFGSKKQQVRARTRKFQELKQSGSDTKNKSAAQMISAPEKAKEQLMQTRQQSCQRIDNKPAQESSRVVQSNAKNSNSYGAVASRTFQRGRRTHSAVERQLNSVCSLKTETVSEQTSNNGTTSVTVVTTLSDVAKQIYHFKTSSLSHKKPTESEVGPLAERYSSSVDKRFEDQTIAEDDAEAKRQRKRKRTNFSQRSVEEVSPPHPVSHAKRRSSPAVFCDDEKRLAKNFDGHEIPRDPEDEAAVIVSTSFDVAKHISHSGMSSLSEKSAESGLLKRCAEDKFFDDRGISKDAEDDAEAKWHQERRRTRDAKLPRSVDDAVILAVTCGSQQAELVLNRLESGSRGACVRQSDGTWLTPNEFQLVGGRANAKDWKRSIRHHGHSLKYLTEQGLLSLASPPLCICEHCDVQV